jgi:hypothetical protein
MLVPTDDAEGRWISEGVEEFEAEYLGVESDAGAQIGDVQNRIDVMESPGRRICHAQLLALLQNVASS